LVRTLQCNLRTLHTITIEQRRDRSHSAGVFTRRWSIDLRTDTNIRFRGLIVVVVGALPRGEGHVYTYIHTYTLHVSGVWTAYVRSIILSVAVYWHTRNTHTHEKRTSVYAGVGVRRARGESCGRGGRYRSSARFRYLLFFFSPHRPSPGTTKWNHGRQNKREAVSYNQTRDTRSTLRFSAINIGYYYYYYYTHTHAHVCTELYVCPVTV